MARNAFWDARYHAERGDYDCPWCDRTLKHRLSNSVKNPGRTFVSCSKDYGGCGLFCFLDAVPDEKHNPNNKGFKRPATEAPARAGGSNIVGPIVSAPNATETRLADLAANVDGLRSDIKAVLDYIKEVNDQ